MTAVPEAALLDSLTRRIAAHTPTRANAAPEVRRAAVAAVLRPDAQGSADLLFIQRAIYAGDPWSGQVALPGGRAEPSDTSLVETAVRETREEVGGDLAVAARLVGALDEIHPLTPLLPPIVVRPHLFVLHDVFEVAPSVEVAAAFWVPLAALLDPTARRPHTVEVSGARFLTSAFVVGERVIWGMTERILGQLLGLPHTRP